MRNLVRVVLSLAFLIPVSGMASLQGGSRQTAPQPKQPASHWLNAMESSVSGLREIDTVRTALSASSILTVGNLLTLSGWAVAMACFFALVSEQKKTRRREKLLERGSKPDIFLYTPKR
jgi:hypothetical protein